MPQFDHLISLLQAYTLSSDDDACHLQEFGPLLINANTSPLWAQENPGNYTK